MPAKPHDGPAIREERHAYGSARKRSKPPTDADIQQARDIARRQGIVIPSPRLVDQWALWKWIEDNAKACQSKGRAEVRLKGENDDR